MQVKIQSKGWTKLGLQYFKAMTISFPSFLQTKKKKKKTDAAAAESNDLIEKNLHLLAACPSSLKEIVAIF
jgi:hypothetical protein